MDANLAISHSRDDGTPDGDGYGVRGEPTGIAPMSIRLSIGELLAFLGILGCVGINGMDEEFLGALSSDELHDAMDRGETSLQERGLIALDDEGKLLLNDVLTALVGASVVPEASLRLVSWREGKRVAEAYYDATPELVVEHVVTKDRYHVFTQIRDRESLGTHLNSYLADPTGDVTAVPMRRYTIPSAALAQCMELCSAQDMEHAARLLEAKGCAADAAHQIVEGLGSGRSWIGMVAAGLRGPSAPRAEGTMVVANGQSCWVARTNADDPDTTILTATTNHESINALLGLFAPLEALMAAAVPGGEVTGDG